MRRKSKRPCRESPQALLDYQMNGCVWDRDFLTTNTNIFPAGLQFQ
jgi:hypothetical protein